MTNYIKTARIGNFSGITALLSLIIVVLMFTGCGGSSKYKVSGQVTKGGVGVEGQTVTLEGPGSPKPATTDIHGNFSFEGLSEGHYTLKPTTTDPLLTFTPAFRDVFLFGFDALDFNFSGKIEGALAASDHSVYVQSAGTVKAWGKNDKGQLGDGTTTDRTAPVTIAGLPNLKAVAAGGSHTVALDTDGKVWTWGSNSNGQLGDNSTNNKATPAQVTGLPTVKAIAAGRDHTVVLDEDGTVWAWGKNDLGQLGDGTIIEQHAPKRIPAFSNINVTAIAAGDSHTVFLKSDKTVLAVGANVSGQLGNGTGINSLTPVAVSGIATAIGISAGDMYTAVLKIDGTVWVCGVNNKGQLGIGVVSDNSLTPVQVRDLTGVTLISAGNQHVVAMKSDGTVWTWGSNSNGQLGIGDLTVTSSAVPKSAGLTGITAGLTGIISVEAGDDYTLALDKDLKLWAWGSNSNGRLGDGTIVDKSTPTAIPIP